MIIIDKRAQIIAPIIWAGNSHHLLSRSTFVLIANSIFAAQPATVKMNHVDAVAVKNELSIICCLPRG
jgi:hypothetical protein